MDIEVTNSSYWNCFSSCTLFLLRTNMAVAEYTLTAYIRWFAVTRSNIDQTRIVKLV